ncbi:cupin 4 family protein [Luminiphilus syltensis NOR5-1B]|uniref:Cupin 4 family protein n=1 Tax=Luminiphilus syltensis NOR5-1B TaxID=565045 RepID=B8KRM1_9GAMM|nr:cupin domain-containing protein [Luminiphilus syltensis]EED34395.1 cupin 4 family protein [Luminiphilus syltensis NOR5-1B]
MTISLDTERFLKHYWQKHPLVIRQAVPDFTPPIDADHLAGLALEPDVQSRIVSCDRGHWEVQHGPFSEADFDRDDQWSLLVQGVDRLLPEVAALQRAVDFLPSWRFDDVMISYASEGGSVGPHFDRYDVFLLQGEGEREWRIGQRCDHTTATHNYDELLLLDDFEHRETHLLQTGDALYIPPGIAHWGIARGPCTTFSLGFRAPSIAALTARLTDSALEQLMPDLLLEDRNSLVSERGRPGEITTQQRDNIRSAVLSALSALDDGVWLGELLTETEPFIGESPEGAVPPHIAMDLGSRINWMETPEGIAVFANGERFPASRQALDVLTPLCAGGSIMTSTAPIDTRALLEWLWAAGVLCDLEDRP